MDIPNPIPLVPLDQNEERQQEDHPCGIDSESVEVEGEPLMNQAEESPDNGILIVHVPPMPGNIILMILIALLEIERVGCML